MHKWGQCSSVHNVIHDINEAGGDDGFCLKIVLVGGTEAPSLPPHFLKTKTESKQCPGKLARSQFRFPSAHTGCEDFPHLIVSDENISFANQDQQFQQKRI